MKTEIKITCDCNAEGLNELLQTLEKLQIEATPVKEGITTVTNGPVTDVTDPNTIASNKPVPEPNKAEEQTEPEMPTRKAMIHLCAKYKDTHGVEKLREEFLKLDPKAGKFADLSQDRWPELKGVLENAI